MYWRGISTMMWDDLLPIVHQIYLHRSFPSIIVICLGESDLLIDSSCSLVTRMQIDLGMLQSIPKCCNDLIFTVTKALLEAI